MRLIYKCWAIEIHPIGSAPRISIYPPKSDVSKRDIHGLGDDEWLIKEAKRWIDSQIQSAPKPL